MIKVIKIFIIFIAVIALISFFGFKLYKPQAPTNLTPTPQSFPQDNKVNIRASFTIITGKIIRSFQSEKYHNKSPDVYIENPDSAIVHVTKSGISWNDFFKTLPMELTKDCLITGDNETLCNGKNGTLMFYLNDIKTPDFLDKEIRQGDKALIKFIF